jgi:hypothetical protein
VGAWFARFFSGYAESAWRVVGIFLGLILWAALGHYALAPTETIADSLYTALLLVSGSGTVQSVTGWLRLLYGSVSLLSSVLLALLVYVLGRRTTH